MPLTSQAYSIQSIYEWYKKDLLIVNRKYQRKLVWSIEEKKMLVDSLLQDFPLPLFLLSKKSEKYEIIDGMQRLNSIFAFIEGEFPILKDKKDLYFDLSTLGSTKQLLDEGKLKQKEPTLDRSICVEFSNYQVAISIVESSEEERIEEIFRRINSYGKHLSPQEIRQAGALGLFSDLVRRLSAIIRRDSSPSDILTLGNMQKISLSTRCLDYGVKIDDVFWIKHKIITPSNLRSSRDEELIAYILLKILREEPCHTTKASDLDKVYADSKEKNFIEKKIQNRSGLEDEFIKIFEQIEFFLGCSDKSLENILYSKGSNGGMTIIFQILFLSMYELIIVEQKEITNPDGIIAALDGVGDELIKKP